MTRSASVVSIRFQLEWRLYLGTWILTHCSRLTLSRNSPLVGTDQARRICVTPGRAIPGSLPSPIPPSAHATLWQPVYNTSGGQPRRTSSAPVRPRNTQGLPCSSLSPLASPLSPPPRPPPPPPPPLLYPRPPAAPPRSHPARYRGRRCRALLGPLCPGSHQT